MDGLIPYIIRAVRKSRPAHGARRSLSENSSRSYHLLLTDRSFEGSSHHRRTMSENQPPSAEVLEQRSSMGLNYNSQLKSFNNWGGNSLQPSSTNVGGQMMMMMMGTNTLTSGIEFQGQSNPRQSRAQL